MRYTLLLFALLAQLSYAQDIAPFQIYNQKGKKIKVKKLMKSLEESDVILFGELHDNPIVHWLQLKTAQYLAEKAPITLGAEMLESDQQAVLDQYLLGTISQEGMDTLTMLWPNYHTDYKPLVDFARNAQLPFVATNIPREYASYVYKNGLEALETYVLEGNKILIAPLPIAYDPNLPGYKAMLDMMGHSTNPNFPKAQAIKDATMAHFIHQAILENNRLFLHFNGDYHSKNYEGIYWYLKNIDSKLNVQTISTVEQVNIHRLNEAHKGRADYIIVVDKEMIKTH